MRILHCIPGMGGGGAERQLAYLTGELVRLRWDVHVALLSGGPNLHRLENAGATIHRLEARSNYDPRILGRLTRTIGRLKPDLVQVWMPQMEILGALAAWYGNVPWILSERSSEGGYPPNFKQWLRRHIAHRADAVVSNSSAGDRYWQARLGAVPPRYVIPNGLPLEDLDAAGAADARRTGVPDSEALVLFAGRLMEHKDPETFVRALVQVLQRPHTTAVIAGEGPLRDAAQAIARRHGIHDRIQFAGYLHDLWSWMKRADVFVSSSVVEGHPNTVLEAAACGCPLVVTDIPAHTEFLDDTSAWFAPTGDAGHLARAIMEVLESGDRAGARAARASHIVAQWSADRIAQQYERVYLDVIERAARRNGH